MTKTPEELTAEWKAGKLEADKEYYIKITDDIVIIDFYTQQYDNSHYPLGLGFDLSSNKFIKKILAPVPTYDEYKAMQKELAELKEKIKKREELIQCLGSNIDELDVKKSVLIIENNKLRGLLKECVKGVDIYYQQLSRINDCPRITTAFWQIEGSKIGLRDLLTRINTALGESEEK